MRCSIAFGRRLGRAAGLLLVLLICALWPGVGHAWWNGEWSTRTKINVDTTAAGAGLTEPVGRTPVLVRLHAGNFDFAAAKEDGSDLRFVAGDDQTPLHFHIEKFDGLLEQVGLIWVDLPALAPGAVTPIFVYYGNPEVGPAADAKNTYGPEQRLVYHFADTAGLPQDVTRYANNAVSSGGQRDDAALIGQGLKLDGTAPLVLPASPSLTVNAAQPLTVSLWAKPAPGTETAVLYAAHDSSGSLVLGIDHGVAYAEINGPDGIVRTPAGPPLAADKWHHLAVSVADRLILYVDGETYAEAAASLPALTGEAVVGGEIGLPPGTPARPSFVGQIDELQIADVARPAGAIRAAALNQGVEQKLLTFEIAESTSASTGYIGILLRSLTVDGWVVIGILAVIAPITWWVMVTKATYLSRMARANAVFEDAFEDTVAESAATPVRVFTALADNDDPTLQRSGLYRLYDVGARELRQRAGDRIEQLQLAPEQLTAIRSALDTSLVREAEVLNRRLVLLTIAISGGPFLGLLGTVVGVMITFAAVAAAGDVNVNAIAPGIAAALVATVAGLSVAIPALFGYNYLITKIKEINAQLQVFSNELIARMAETFRARAAPSPQRLAGE